MDLNHADLKTPREYFESVLKYSLENGATDIHFSPQADGVYVYLRIMSKLVSVSKLDFDFYKKLSYWLKELAKTNPVSKQPQDGRLEYKAHDGKMLKMRFAAVWSKPLSADKIAIRIADKDASLLKLEALSFSESDLEKLRLALEKSFGLVLTVGPTGSGKTTTLYAALNYIKSLSGRVILTIEEPVEQFIDKTVQVEVSPDVRFNTVLRNFLRQDPDVIMIGEIRDAETAEVAVRSALTGHLVLSTLHANSALLAVQRLVDLGIDPFNLCSVLYVIQSQRLARRICKNCRISRPIRKIEAEMFKKLSTDIPSLVYDENASGCPECVKGTVGRFSIYELIVLDTEDQSELYTQVRNGKNIETTFLQYLKDKYSHISLTERAARFAADGEISISEALKLL